MNTSIVKGIRWITWASLFIIPFLPLFVSNSLFFPFITGKNFAFRILVEIAFAGWVLLALADAKYRPKFSWTGALFAAFVVWMAIADALAVNPAKAFWSNFERMDGWITLIHVFALFVVLGAVLGADKLWRKWLFTTLGVAAAICLYALLQTVGILAIHQGSTRVDATFGNSEYLAAYLLFTMAISMWYAFEAKSQKWLRYGLFAFAAVQVIILFLTETRGAILAFVGAIVLSSILWMIESGKNGRRAAAGVFVGILIVVLIFIGVRHTAFVQKIPGLDRVASISLQDGEATARLGIWNMAYQGFLEKPIHGWGQEGFNYVFNKYYTPSFYSQEPYFDRAHDIFLDWLIAGGAPALLLFVGLLIAAVLALYRSKSLSRTERIMLISALAAYSAQGIFVFDNLITYILLAMVLALAHDGSARPFAKLENLKPISSAQLETIAAPIIGVVLLATIYFVNVPNIEAATDLITAISPSSGVSVNLAAFKKTYADNSFANQEITEQLAQFAETVSTDSSISTADKETVLTYAAQQMNALIIAIPNDARLRLEFAFLLRAGGDYKDALAEVKIAEQLSPEKQSVLIEEGIDDWQLGDFTSAQAAFSKAYNLDTSFPDLAAYAAAGEIANNNIAGGKAILQTTFGTTTVDQNVLLVAYYQAKDYPDFIAVAEKMAADQGNSANAQFSLASALAQVGENAQARAVVEAAIAAHPEAANEGASLLQQIPAN